MIQTGIIQKIELASDIKSLTKIESFIDGLYEQYKFGGDHYGNILIALTEAVNNAITHGNQFDPSKKVNLNMEASESEVCFVVKDEGVGFDFNNVPDPTLPENLEKIRGRGVFLMKTLADELGFEENGSVVRLNFYISSK